MNQVLHQSLRTVLSERREKLQQAIAQPGETADLARLLVEVDRALQRIESDDFGRCVVCDGVMDEDEMQANPLRQYCLCDLSEQGRAELQNDLDLAWQIQVSVLPEQDLRFAGWQTHFRYQPAGAVSGDYCDLITHASGEEWLYFLVGDVSGKGVAASWIMAQLNALVRRTLDVPVSVECLINTVNRHISSRSPATHFVTLVAGRANAEGRVEMANAGHCRPLVLSRHAIRELDATGIPVGITGATEYQVLVEHLLPGDSLLLYTDGISEAWNRQGEVFGVQNLIEVAARHRASSPALLATACLTELKRFREPNGPRDDTTIMVVHRELQL